MCSLYPLTTCGNNITLGNSRVPQPGWGNLKRASLCYNFRMRLLTFLLFFVALSMLGQTDQVKPLHELFTTEWDYEMQQHPEEASNLGDRRWNDRWTDESLDAHAKRYQHNQDVLARLKKIDRNALSPAEQLNY